MAQSADTDQQTGADSQVPVFTTVDGRRLIPVVPPEAAVSAEESTDTVVDKLAGNFSESVVNEVRKYGKPEWEQTESSTLDPIEDIEDMYTYDFKLPPHVHDKYVEAAAGDIVDLEQLKGPVDTELLAKIEQRRKLTEGRHADDVKWLKHKAYYRGINKVRAAKKQLEQIAAEDAEDAAVASTAVASPSSSLNPQPSQPHPALYSADEVLAGISDPSEWDMSYTAASYQQHPEVLQQLRSSFAACLGLPYVSPQQQQEREQQLRQALAQQQEEQQQAAELAAAKEAFVKKYTPFHAYTPEYLAHKRRQQQLAGHRRHKQQAFWLSLGLAVGSSAVRWWQRRLQRQQQQQQRRAGSVTGSSRRSTRPPTPQMLRSEAIAE